MYYDPEIARWLSVDPEEALAFNITPYHYTHNNPLNRFDPDGKIDCDLAGMKGTTKITEEGLFFHQFLTGAKSFYVHFLCTLGYTCPDRVNNRIFCHNF